MLDLLMKNVRSQSYARFVAVPTVCSYNIMRTIRVDNGSVPVELLHELQSVRLRTRKPPLSKRKFSLARVYSTKARCAGEQLAEAICSARVKASACSLFTAEF